MLKTTPAAITVRGSSTWSQRIVWLIGGLLALSLLALLAPHAGASDSLSPALGNMPDRSDLRDSRKYASQDTVQAGHNFTYYIELVNSGQTTATVDVVDTLPPQVVYVEDSASHGGTYYPGRAAIVWDALPVPAGESLTLSFEVAAAAVEERTEVVNVAAIASQHQRFVRLAKVSVVPGDGDAPSINVLYHSRKTVSQRWAGPGDLLTFSIGLRNSGNENVIADVSDPLPELLSYVEDSASPAGSYDADSRTLSWEGVVVPAGGSVQLSFDVLAATVEEPTPVINVATIQYGDFAFDRQATVILLATADPPAPRPILAGSAKVASPRVVAPGEQIAYTIYLINSGTQDALADVVDPLPALISYVEGSATHGGVYDGASRTIAWSQVPVPAGGTVELSFEALAGQVNYATPVRNVAAIVMGEHTFERQAVVVIMPEAPRQDYGRPFVHSVTIADRDVLTSPNVTLHISATDDVSVETMFIQEWRLVSDAMPRWQLVKDSGWISFATHYPWVFSSHAGVHFVGVTVADGNGNQSVLIGNAIDFASLLLPQETVVEGEGVAYMVYYEAGVDVTATLVTHSGDADLYVWFPNQFGEPSLYSIEPGIAIDQVAFTAGQAGRYVFLVHGYQSSVYSLDITPAGGPRVPVDGSLVQPETVIPAFPAPEDSIKIPLIGGLPFNLSGIDPLAGAQAPQALRYLYLPISLR